MCILLPRTSFLRRFLLAPLGGRGRSLQCLLLIVLPHYGVMRLVPVILTVERRLLLDPRIPLPRILPLVNR